MTLYDNLAIKERVQAAWEKVFYASGQVLRQAEMFGFYLVDKVPTPNIHDMLVTLRGIDSLMDLLIAHSAFGGDHDDMRKLLNAREQVNRMERVAFALRRDDKSAYEEAITALEKQAVF